MSWGAFRFFLLIGTVSWGFGVDLLHAEPPQIRAQTEAFASSIPQLKDTDAETNQYGLIVDFDLKYSFAEDWSTQFNPWLRANMASKDSAQKFNFEPLEAQLQYKKGSRKIVFGFHRSPWEGTDIINPMDMVFAKNYLDPLNPGTKSAAGVFYSEDYGFLALDLFYIPAQQKPLLPGNHSPWWPRQLYLPTDSSQQELQLPERVAYDVRAGEEINSALSNNVAMRLQKTLGPVDISIAGFDGAAQSPILTPLVVVTPLSLFPKEVFLLESPVVITPTYYRTRIGAFAMTSVIGSTILRFSGQHAQPVGDSRLLPGWSDLAVIEVERTVSLRKSEITLLAEAIYSRRQESKSLSSLSSLLEKAGMIGFRWPFKENWSWIAAYYQEFKFQSSFIHTEMSWNHSDHWKSTLAMDFINGNQNSPLGSYNKNAQALYRLIYSY